MLNLEPLINKVQIMTTDISAITFTAKSVWALVAALAALMFAFSDKLVELRTGTNSTEAIKTEITSLKKTIHNEHLRLTGVQNNLLADLHAFKLLESERHATQDVELGRAKTDASYMRRDIEKILESVDSLHDNLDEHDSTKIHPYP